MSASYGNARAMGEICSDQQQRHRHELIDVVLVPLLLTVNIFHTFFFFFFFVVPFLTFSKISILKKISNDVYKDESRVPEAPLIFCKNVIIVSFISQLSYSNKNPV